MMSLSYFRTETIETLRQTINDRLAWYFDPSCILQEVVPGKPIETRASRLEAPHLADQLSMDANRPSDTDVDNALTVYRSLANLTPHQSSIERLWSYLCHCDCPQYVAWRWLRDRPKDDIEAERKVRNHFFATDNRSLIRDNALSRLWWLGKIAHEVAPKDPKRFLTILLHRQDVRSALIERPSVSMNKYVLRHIYAVMREHWSGNKDLFKRENFRAWMVALNRRGGVVLLDALPSVGLGRLLDEEAELAIKDAA